MSVINRAIGCYGVVPDVKQCYIYQPECEKQIETVNLAEPVFRLIEKWTVIKRDFFDDPRYTVQTSAHVRNKINCGKSPRYFLSHTVSHRVVVTTCRHTGLLYL